MAYISAVFLLLNTIADGKNGTIYESVGPFIVLFTFFSGSLEITGNNVFKTLKGLGSTKSIVTIIALVFPLISICSRHEKQ